ncbi:Miniconductance mechanosensitive channel YbdG [Planctomycetes bacterium Poly30]|uniref:Miniconductance mechanosensitive channel YbdG n=1 Tax=Saltatorellus ferox TaxID=2528018 RepID=A0A518EL44_9BACT|nr:Miniconductance mechanosensitive channel YbdG [Planctomycetes bacterium Poly30]
MSSPHFVFCLIQAPRLEPLERLAEPSRLDEWLHTGGAWLGVAVLAVLANLFAKKVIVRGISKLVRHTKTTWDDLFVDHDILERLSHLAPALVIYLAAPFLLNEPEDQIYEDYLRRFANAWMILAGARAIHALIEALVDVGQRSHTTRAKPLRSYAQVAELVIWLAAAILSVSVIMQRSPTVLLTGLGAMTAILLLVFKDSILGFLASLRLASNDMLRVGDWVEVPSYGADGDVIDIGLHTVKVQNWDKTISMVPTHSFVTGTFKNWRGMTESGGRRIKRCLSLDMTSVRFLDDADVERLRKIQCLRPYLDLRAKEVAAWNEVHSVDAENPVNGRRLTNLGTFRAYIEAYLEGLEPIREDMTFLVRQLAPSATGIPLEIYCFSREQRWKHFEGIMGDIFDHLLAAVGQFDLRVYQQPGSEDLRKMVADRLSVSPSPTLP